MAGPDHSTSSRFRKSRALPWLILVGGLALSASSWYSVRAELQRQEEARFERQKERVLAAIDARFQSAEQALFGARALIETSGDVPHARWARYVASEEKYFDRGVVGIGYVQRIP